MYAIHTYHEEKRYNSYVQNYYISSIALVHHLILIAFQHPNVAKKFKTNYILKQLLRTKT